MTTAAEQTSNIEIAVQGVTEIHSTDNETYLYGAVAVTVNGQAMDVGIVVGARESNRETASRVGLRGLLTAYYEDSSDWAGLEVVAREQGLDVAELRDAVRNALVDAAPRLWRESADMRAESVA